MDKKVKELYTYSGPVYRFKRVLSSSWDAETQAISKRQAISFLEKQAKEYFGYIPTSKVNIDPSLVVCQGAYEDPEPKCEVCGQLLDDSGRCPYCEFGETIEESLNDDMKTKVKDLVDTYNDEDTSKISLFETEPGTFNEKFDGVDIDFSKFAEHKDDNGNPYYTFMITGGLNGSGDWEQYLKDIRNLFITLQTKLKIHPVLYKLECDTADDVWTGKVFLYWITDLDKGAELNGLLEEYPDEGVEDKSLSWMTPYMLRNDGKLLKCGEIHPYMKMSTKTSYETNIHTLMDVHPNFLDWFYNNTLNEKTKELITEFKKNQTPELLDELNNLTNQEFCRVRTSNYKIRYGGDNGEIFFRICSTGFNWFDLIWNTVASFVNQVQFVTVMKDRQVLGGKEFDYYFNHMPIDDFLTLEGNPIIESIEKETIDEDIIINGEKESVKPKYNVGDILIPKKYDGYILAVVKAIESVRIGYGTYYKLFYISEEMLKSKTKRNPKKWDWYYLYDQAPKEDHVEEDSITKNFVKSPEEDLNKVLNELMASEDFE